MGCGNSNVETPQPVVIIGYWGGMRGAGQPVRYFAEYVGAKWENKNYDFTQWGPEKQQLVAKGQSLANLPYLKDGERIIFESSAIPIFLAYRHNRSDALARTVDELISVATVQGAMDDLRQALVKVLLVMPRDKFQQEGRQALKRDTAPLLTKLDWSLKGKKFILGDRPVWEDFTLFEVTDLIRLFDIDFLKQYPNLFNLNNSIRDIKEISAYMNTPRFQIRPFFSTKMANWG